MPSKARVIMIFFLIEVALCAGVGIAMNANPYVPIMFVWAYALAAWIVRWNIGGDDLVDYFLIYAVTNSSVYTLAVWITASMNTHPLTLKTAAGLFGLGCLSYLFGSLILLGMFKSSVKNAARVASKHPELRKYLVGDDSVRQ